MKENFKNISIVIANYNRKDYLHSCLKSIENQTEKPLEVIVVDNASCDGSVQMVKQEFVSVIIIENKKNRYFAASYNQGICCAKGDFILCINNDVVLDSNFLLNILNSIDIDSRIGIWGGKVLRLDRETVDSTGQFLSRGRRAIERGYGLKDNGKFKQKEYVFGIGGAVALFRKKMLEEIKIENEYFDEDFKLCYEDLDLNWRANRFGWKAYYVPEATAYHFRGGTLKADKPAFRFLEQFSLAQLPVTLQAQAILNRYLTIIKNDKFLSYARNFIFIFSYDFRILFYTFLFKPAILLNLTKSLPGLKKAFKKRRLILEKLKLQYN